MQSLPGLTHVHRSWKRKDPGLTGDQVQTMWQLLGRLTKRIGKPQLLRQQEYLQPSSCAQAAERAKATYQVRGNNSRNLAAEEFFYLNQFCVDKADIAILMFDANFQIHYANDCAAKILDYSREELSSMNISDIEPNFNTEAWQEMHEIGLNINAAKFESTLRRKGGVEIPVEMSINKVEHAGNQCNLYFAYDISERKKAEQQFHASLRQKEILLREVHHQVKNNLQVVTSMIALQSDYCNDQRTQRFFRDIQDRVWSMALIHEQVYQARDCTRINLGEYVESLTSYLFIAGTDHIPIFFETDTIIIGIAEATPCGTILNELLTNSIKHGFPDNRKGKITISCRYETNDRISLTVADTGVGLPPGFNVWNTESLGLQIVTLLVNQLQGDLEIDNTCGTSFKITFQSNFQRNCSTECQSDEHQFLPCLFKS